MWPVQPERNLASGLRLILSSFAAVVGVGILLGLGAFVLGFIFGLLRVVFVAPALGPVPAVLLEVALFLPVLWWAVRVVCEKAAIARFDARCMVGVTAFTTLLAMEFGFALTVMQLSFQGYVATILSPAGLIGLAGQAGLLVMPAFSRRLFPTSAMRARP